MARLLCRGDRRRDPATRPPARQVDIRAIGAGTIARRGAFASLSLEETDMPTVTESVRIPMHADILWLKIGGFGSVGEWHPLLREVRSEGDHVGARRFVETQAGERREERLALYDSEGHSYDYILESSALPVR